MPSGVNPNDTVIREGSQAISSVAPSGALGISARNFSSARKHNMVETVSDAGDE